MSVQRYRQKPVVIEAMRVDEHNATAVAAWCNGRTWTDMMVYPESDRVTCVDIFTLEGTMTAHLGDWIIRGVAGEFYPCKPDIFEVTYEPVTS